MKTIKKDWESLQKINIETYLKKVRIKKKEYGKNRYHNMSEEKKQRLKEYQKNYRKAKKSQYIIMNKIVFLKVYALI